ncbi:outer membrane beta-barrel protein [Leptolyngbya sp. FACHB-261]|uniref:outer membrane beta-barrel protein n=1 Tax=Leptolyngbya sp. FACHB-261 TaxID=2692806 RepID=UPI001683C058|nr:outer membrane beta-barrel protein [Leptolyngbya sp. FACHB-261]MBD2105254.1 hypothetical protein [Leptolyngbya sp. FACHB-261]
MHQVHRILHQPLCPVFLGSTLIALGVTAISQPAQAQAAYGSYIGGGAAFGVTSGEGGAEDNATYGLVTARYRFLQIPISLRTQVLIGRNTAIVPTVSYDFPLSWNADAYVGVGASLSDGDIASPLGNKNSFAIQPGIDYSLPNSNLVLFGNAIFALDAYRNDGGAAISLQTGVGLRF